MSILESLREPLVDKGVIPSLLRHLTSENISLATQVCRALGNICYDNGELLRHRCFAKGKLI